MKRGEPFPSRGGGARSVAVNGGVKGCAGRPPPRGPRAGGGPRSGGSACRPGPRPARCAGDLDAAARCWTLAHGVGLALPVAGRPAFRLRSRQRRRRRPASRPPPSRRRAASARVPTVALRAGLGREDPARAAGAKLAVPPAPGEAATPRPGGRISGRSCGSRSRRRGQASMQASSKRRGRSPAGSANALPIFDDTRRLLGACYLMAYAVAGPPRVESGSSPPASGGGEQS